MHVHLRSEEKLNSGGFSSREDRTSTYSTISVHYLSPETYHRVTTNLEGGDSYSAVAL